MWQNTTTLPRRLEALNNSQPNITRAMNCLEQQLNTTLFIRTNRGVQLTRKENGFIIMC
ncbi:MAG: LysR family transcriptional regulator [Ruminococcus sp.]